MHIDDERLEFDLQDGRKVTVPLAFYPTLMLATAEDRGEFEIWHAFVYWPRLDCDISSECLLRGSKESRKYAERAWRRKSQPQTS